VLKHCAANRKRRLSYILPRNAACRGFLLGILIFKGLTARRLYKSFGVKRWILIRICEPTILSIACNGFYNIIFINCKWVDTRWQCSIYIFHMHGLWKLVTLDLGGGGLHWKHVVATWKGKREPILLRVQCALFVKRIKRNEDLAMAQNSGCWSKIFHIGGRPCAIFGGQIGARTGFSSSDSVFPASVIPPTMYCHLLTYLLPMLCDLNKRMLC
jgi:hypothetical protein